MEEGMSIDPNDFKPESGEESVGSIPEVTNLLNTSTHDSLPVRRKGGRKPIYATSEERKQRNRQAQAAFRERRTEYIKQLEAAIRTHEQNLAHLQAAHRQAADECLMLRYKNSLLERILLEKGIDVKTELRAKTGSPTLGQAHMPQNLVQPPIQRAILNRHNARQPGSSIAAELEPGINVTPLPPPLALHSSETSPASRPTPSSHSASPTAATSYSSNSPVGSDHLPRSMRQPNGPGPVKMPLQQPMNAAQVNTSARRQTHMPGLQQGGMSTQSRPSMASEPHHGYPAFRTHYEQLDQEYNAHDMLDKTSDNPVTPGALPSHSGYPNNNYANDAQQILSSPNTTGPPGGRSIHGQQSQMTSMGSIGCGGFPSMAQLLGDPSFESDPFGLNTIMTFPQFSFDTSNLR